MGTSRDQGAMNGSSSSGGIAIVTVIRKNAGQPSDSAIFPAGATSMSLLAAMRLESNANWVAVKRLLHMLIRYAVIPAVTRPNPKFSVMIAATMKPWLFPARDKP